MESSDLKLILIFLLFGGFPVLYFISSGIFATVRLVKSYKERNFKFKYAYLPLVFWLVGSAFFTVSGYFLILFSLFLLKKSL